MLHDSVLYYSGFQAKHKKIGDVQETCQEALMYNT